MNTKQQYLTQRNSQLGWGLRSQAIERMCDGTSLLFCGLETYNMFDDLEDRYHIILEKDVTRDNFVGWSPDDGGFVHYESLIEALKELQSMKFTLLSF